MAASKQDYLFIAAVFHREHEKLDAEGELGASIKTAPRERLHLMASKIAKHFAQTNRHFDRDKFGQACSTFWDDVEEKDG